MKVYTLVGKSGTGKSYQAMRVCREKNIASIIDDGLFIVGSGILAGTSAKRQTTKVGAVKTALFTEDDHRDEVVKKIAEIAPDSILIIGISKTMTDNSAATLGLPAIEETIEIESITTEDEREAAKKQRHDLGKHVIPVPTFQLKREFSGYFLDPLRIFRSRSKGGGKGVFSEKSVVRPTYSYMGDYIISDKVISDIIRCVSGDNDDITVTKVMAENVKGSIFITVVVFARYGCQMLEAATRLQADILTHVGHMTAFHIDRVNIEIKGLR